MDETAPEDVRGCLRELGQALHKPLQVQIGGSVALILQDYLSRKTEDIDFINEVPAELRSRQRLLDDLQRRYGLHMGRVQSQDYPSGFQDRAHSLPPFGRLHVYLLDVYDVFLGKLFSKREQDLDDLRAVAPLLDKETVVQRLRDTAQAFLKDQFLRPYAEHNWYILFGDPLPT